MVYSSLSTIAVFALFFLVLAYPLRFLAWPKPYPGIPYHEQSAKRVLGDVPELLLWKTGNANRKFETWAWIREQNVALDSPVVQLFLRPLGKPFIIVADYREATDVLLKRNREFDRSDFFRDLFALIVPLTMAHFKTGEQYWAHRRLMANTMSNSFLHTVAGPQIYAKAVNAVRLWKVKSHLALGRAFTVKEDVTRLAFDVIWAATFSSDIGAIQAQIKASSILLSQLDHIKLANSEDEAAEFPVAEDPAAFRSLTALAASVETVTQVPIFPVFAHKLQLWISPHLRWAKAYKDQILAKLIVDAEKKFDSKSIGEEHVASALELMVQREAATAEKERRRPRFDRPEIRDELLSFLIGGHGTTSATLCWSFKLLTLHQDVQSKLRSSLTSALERAHLAKEDPTLEEILDTDLPYLDAVIEELHRCGGTVPAISRNVLEDTQILGHAIPKGAEVFFIIDGPGYTIPPVRVEESLRSKSSQDDKNKYHGWDPSTIGLFMPERWLAHGESGKVEFRPNAGPIHAFGAGPRGCFGRKFASLEMRTIIALIIWNFKLLPLPDHLASFAGHDKILHEPEMCYLRIVEVR